jgi:hypothetical protein
MRKYFGRLGNRSWWFFGTKSETGPNWRKSGSSALRICRFRDTSRFRGIRILMILRGSRTSRSGFGVALVTGEGRPLRPRTLLLWFAGF